MKLSPAILVASVSGYTPPKPYRKALAKNEAVSIPTILLMDLKDSIIDILLRSRAPS